MVTGYYKTKQVSFGFFLSSFCFTYGISGTTAQNQPSSNKDLENSDI